MQNLNTVLKMEEWEFQLKRILNLPQASYLERTGISCFIAGTLLHLWLLKLVTPFPWNPGNARNRWDLSATCDGNVAKLNNIGN